MQTEKQTDVQRQVDTLATQTLALYRQHQRRNQQREAEQTRLRDQQMVATFRTLLETELESDLLTALNVHYLVRHDRSDWRVEAAFTYADVDWRLFHESARQTTDWQWSIKATEPGGSSSWPIQELSTSVQPLAFRTTLLIKLGERREQVLQQAQEAEEREQRSLQLQADAHAEEERIARELESRIAQADQEDAGLRAELDTLKQRALATMWRWPEGVRIPIYHLTYNTAVGRSEDGEALIEQENGWTAVDHLDSEGYIRLEESIVTRAAWIGNGVMKPYEVKLDGALHLPTWERLWVTSTEDVPLALREEITVSIPSVVSRYHRALDDKRRLVRVEEYDFEESAYCEHIGYVPLPWIQALAEQAAHKERQ